MPTSLAASFEKPCKKQQLKNLCHGFHSSGITFKDQKDNFFYFEYSSKDSDPKIRWENVLDFFIAQDFFL